MPITIGSNIASLTAQRRLSESTSKLSKTYERLSSGQRINSAADDAAGLAISESLKSDRRVFIQGVRNFNDGISLLNIADGAIDNLSNIVVRLKELSEQSANGTYSATQRKAIDKEAQALSKEYTRIAQSTKFNGLNLLNGSTGDVRLQGGYGTDGGIQSGLGGAIGTGSFGTSTSFITEVGFSPTSANDIAFGDLNGDGIADMVTAGTVSNINGYVTIRMGLGSGNFAAASSYFISSGSAAGDVNLSDINGDGILDILASTYGGGTIVTLLGNGNGTFGSSRSFSMNAGITDIAVADLNSDGFLDIATGGTGGSSGNIAIRLGAGNGTFGAMTSYTGNTSITYAVALGDINGDGILDMVNGGDDSLLGRVMIRLGNGNGTFGSAISYDMEISYTADVELADLNNDGKLDIISGGVGAGGGANVRLGNGNGTFGAAASYLMGNSSVVTIALGDLNGDGILDLTAAGYFTNNSIRLGTGNGSFGAETTYDTGIFQTLNSALADINDDGVLDFITAGLPSSLNAGVAVTRIGQTRSGASSLLPFDLSTLAGARQALPVFDKKIQQLASQRGTIGAFQSRIQVGINNLQSAAENYAAAEGRIRNADIAQESAELTRLNILQKAASSVLSQANLQPQLALKLLQ